MPPRRTCHASAHQLGWVVPLATATFPAGTEPALLGCVEAAGAEAGVDAAGLPGALADGFDIADELGVGAGVGVRSTV